MKKIPYIIIAILLVVMFVLCTSPQKNQGGGLQSTLTVPESTSALTVEASEIIEETEPEPTPFVGRDVSVCGKTFNTRNRKLDLSNIRASDVGAVCEIFEQMPDLEYVDIGGESNGLSWEDLSKLYAAAPNARFSYSFTMYGQELNTYDRVLDFNHYTITDNAEGVKQILPFMRNCTTLDMDSCGIDNETMASIRDAYPNIEVIWRIWMAWDYSFRTNVEKILASKPTRGGDITNEDAQQFKYCTNLKYLDLGHNEELSDFSFISELKNLRIAVVSITAINDLTPFENCSKLFYLEAGNTKISDLSPLAKCTNLQHLNVGTCFDVKDISPLYDLNLKRLWLGVGDPVPAEQVEQMRALHPGIEIDTTCPTGYEGGTIGLNEGFVMGKWKSYKQYLAADWAVFQATGSFPSQHPKSIFRIVYDAFEYALNPACYSFVEYDPLYNPHDSIYGSTRGAAVDMNEDLEKGEVLYLVNDSEKLEAWQNLASVYTASTGTKVTVKSNEQLKDALMDVDAPTMFEINGPVDLMQYTDNCLDIASSDVCSQLTSDEYVTYNTKGEALGIAKNITSYGVLVNKKLLSNYGIDVSSIKDYDSFQVAVAAVTEQRNVTSSVAAFVSTPMNDLSFTSLTNRLVMMPIASELDKDGVGLKKVLDGTYMDVFHRFWDLIIYNQNCSYYDLSPAAMIQRTNEDSCREFLAGDGVFFVCGSEIWDYIEKDGRLSSDDIAYIPIYMGIEGETDRGFCSEIDSYWAVNKNADEKDIEATLDFLNWVVTSKEGTEAMAQMGYVIPYKNAVESSNPLVMTDREYTASGKTPLDVNYPMLPTESWKDEVNYEMGAYSANLGDYGDIYGEVITVWAGEYAVK